MSTASISPAKLKSVFADPQKSADVLHLVYVNDKQEGIKRNAGGKKFSYTYRGKKIIDKKTIQRIKSLVIPPAWKDVWICKKTNGHLQATGLDARKRKQYKYHTLWNKMRNHTKYSRLVDFGKSIKSIRKKLDEDLRKPGLSQDKVLAAVVSLMETTSIRVGNNFYEKLYGSFGLTTLKDRHVKIRSGIVQFAFKGKKGVLHHITLNNKRLAAIVKKCRDIPGKELFQYKDENGKYKPIDSGMVNHYIKSISGTDFTAKDFRTWCGSVHALEAFKTLGFCDTIKATKKNIAAAIDMVSKHLGNTGNVCKKYYVHPLVISLYENRKLESYFQKVKRAVKEKYFSAEEKLLVHILQKEPLHITSY